MMTAVDTPPVVRFPIPKLRFAAGYMCRVDYDHELGSTDVVVYPTLQALREAHPCWEECGIVMVEVRLVKVIHEGTL